jgi:hypothetical protein
MTEPFEELAAGLMEQRDALSFALTTMHRTHTLLLSTLARMAEQPAHPLDPNTMNAEQLATLGERLWEASPLKNTVETCIDNWLDSELQGRMSDYVDSLEIQVDVSASIRDGN